MPREIATGPRNKEWIKQAHKAAKEYQDWKVACERFLQQKCKIKWLKEGDRNMKIFHSYLKARRNANKIFLVQDKDGNEKKNMEGITEAFIDFYTMLLQQCRKITCVLINLSLISTFDIFYARHEAFKLGLS
ncbi:hypothetical protein P3L10_021975 [Capsicum annuum]